MTIAFLWRLESPWLRRSFSFNLIGVCFDMGQSSLSFKILLAGFTFLFSLVMLELAARTTTRLTLRQRLLQYDSTLGWKLVPSTKKLDKDDEEPYLIEINSKGLRDTEHSYTRPTNAFRVVFIGDSFVFGSGGVSAQDRFPERLEKSSANLEAINMGVPGYSTDQEYLYLKTEGLKYHPNLVVICMFANDFDESFTAVNPYTGRPKGYFSAEGVELQFHAPAASLFFRLADRTYLGALAEHAVRMFRQRHGFIKPDLKVGDAEAMRAFRLLLLGMRDSCREAGADLLLVYIPCLAHRGHWWRVSSEVAMRNIMGDLARTEGFKTLDLTDYMQAIDAKRPAYFRRDGHLNEYGHQVVGMALNDLLQKTRELKAPVSVVVQEKMQMCSLVLDRLPPHGRGFPR